MKLRHLLFGLLAGVAFVACTNDNEPAGVTPVKGDNEVATRSYMKVNFVMPGNAVTRADAEGDAFEYGTDAENAVTNGVLFFFDDNKLQVAEPFELPADLGWDGETTASIEKVSDIIVVLENPLKNPTSVVAVLNLGNKAALEALGIKGSSSLDELKAIVGDYATSKTESGKFVMSSSAYNEAENKIAAKIGTVYETREAAEGAPSVKIPVERVVAKVNVTAKASYDTGSTMGEGESAVAIKARIDGWWLDNVASQSLLLKKIDTAPSFADWNDKANMRSYWANPNTGTLKHGLYSTNKADKYVQENVDAANPTQVVVAATLTDANGNALPLVKFKGKLYTKADFEVDVLGILAAEYFHKETTTEGDEFTSITASDIKVTYAKVTDAQYKAQATIAYKGATDNLYQKVGTAYNAVTDFDADDKAGYTIQLWENGQTYYYVPIEHVAKNGNTPAVTGVVRNHVYKLTVKSVTGLGTPVPFTDKEIIPTIPEKEKETYISCEIDILAWKIVGQDVDLGK
jgi:hypothetical protein